MTKKKKIILIAVNAVFLIAAIVFMSRCKDFGNVLQTQKVAEVWAGDSDVRMTQVSAFFAKGEEKDKDSLWSFRTNLKNKLSDSGIEDTDDKACTHAYAAFGTRTVQGEHGKSEAQTIFVGGDFFLFHPYVLLSGSYINDDDLMYDRVVIDKELAWQLFGGEDVAGMSLTIDDKPYYIAGVIERESDRFSKRALKDEKPLMFISYESRKEDDPQVSEYEVVAPNPIDSFVLNTAKESFEKAQILENSARFNFEPTLKSLKNYGEKSIVYRPISYSYWENAARLCESILTLNYAIIILFLIIPFITLVWLIVKLCIWLNKKRKALNIKLKEMWEDRYGIKERRKQEKANKQPKQRKKIFKGKLNKVKIPKLKSKSKPKVLNNTETPQEKSTKEEIAITVESIMHEFEDK